MNLFENLRDHARRIPDDIATSSPRHRLTTYRKLWSRIERASARLQGEWLVTSGDTVMYVGNGHADALVLWLALARLGAVLMPLETRALRDHASAIADRHGVRLLLHDDDMPAPLADDYCSCVVLSSLISRHCAHDVISCPAESGLGTSMIATGLVATDAPHLQYCAYSLHDLMQQAGPPACRPATTQPLFDPRRLRSQILPALTQGWPLLLA